MKKKNLSVMSIGTVSLMMIFIILCMITLASISLASSSADAHLGRKMTDHLTDYYTASNEAEELLALADDIFANAYQNTNTAEEYYSLIQKELPLNSIEAIKKEDTLNITFQVKINTSQALYVLINVLSPQQIQKMGAGSFYKILSWQIISTVPWESDNTIQLIQ